MQGKKILGIVLRCAISIGLLIYVGSTIQFYDTPEGPGLFSLLKQVKLPWITLGFVLIATQIWIATLRWKILLQAQGISLPYWQVFRLTYLGIFFNNFLPGALGGDVIKAMFVCQDTEFKTKAVVSIIFDRFTGLLSLCGICLISACFLAAPNQNLANLKTLIYYSIPIVFAIVGIIFFLSNSSSSSRWQIFNKGFLGEIKSAFQNYRNKLSFSFKALGLSLIAHIIIILVNVIYARALGIVTLPIWYYFVFIPIIFLITSLPISLAGWGIGEAGYREFMGLWSVSGTSAVALSVLFRLSITLWSLPAGLLLIRKSRGSTSVSSCK